MGWGDVLPRVLVMGRRERQIEDTEESGFAGGNGTRHRDGLPALSSF